MCCLLPRDYFSSQLSTGAADVTAEAGSARPVDLAFGQDFLEYSQRRRPGGLEPVRVATAVFDRIVDDQIDHTQAQDFFVLVDEICQCVGIVYAVIDSPEHQVLDHQFSVRFRDISIESRHQLLQWIGPVDWHQDGTQTVDGRMQGDRQVDLPVFGRETFNTGNNTARRD